jgi:hypothetical protein
MELSQKQQARISYESMLLKIAPEQLYYIAPYLFHEGITAANTKVEQLSDIEELKEKAKEVLNSFNSEEFHSFY